MEHFWIHVTISLLLLLANRIKLGEATGKTTGAKDDFVRVHVPAYVREGGTAFLKCLYDVDTDKLYSMKWYKGAKEFFRFTPMESPPIKIFPEFGGQVDMSLSNISDVALVHLDLNMTDKYTCEVTKDFPYYTTSMKAGKMTVVAFPEHRPFISAESRSVSIGDSLNVNCTSFRSSPVANITWLLNGFPVSPHYLIPPDISRDDDQKETITSSIVFTVRQQHLIRSRMNITCQAKIEPDLYSVSVDVLIVEQGHSRISSVVDGYSSLSSETHKRSPDSGLTISAGTSRAIPTAVVSVAHLFLQILAFS